MDASREQFVRQTRRPISLLRRSGLGSVSLRLVIFIGQNPQPTPSGWKAVRQVRSSAESPNEQEHSGLRVLRWTAGDQQHWGSPKIIRKNVQF
jgi:hypothetical protein